MENPKKYLQFNKEQKVYINGFKRYHSKISLANLARHLQGKKLHLLLRVSSCSKMLENVIMRSEF